MAWSSFERMSQSEDLLRKVRALLQKAERTDNEHEADAFYEAAQRLMVKYALDEADLAPDEREAIEVRRVVVGASSTDHQLMWDIAAGLGQVKALRHDARPASQTAFALIGFPADVDFVLLLHASLLLQRELSLRTAPRPEGESARTFNRSFRMGFSAQIRRRLRTIHHKVVEQSAAPGTDLVLVTRHDQVQRAYEEAFPSVSTVRVSSGASRSGYANGGAAANRADISGGRGHVRNQRRRITA